MCRPVAELLELARNVPLTVVPIRPLKRQPEAEAQLPELPGPAPLRSALDPDRPGAELPVADADHPGTPEADQTKVSHCGTSP